jgi:hypothetical protein
VKFSRVALLDRTSQSGLNFGVAASGLPISILGGAGTNVTAEAPQAR